MKLWEKVGLPTYSLSDTIPELERFLRRNPETSLGGWLDGKMAATVLGGFDGRRGLVHHLAVAPDLQRRGIGRRMMEELEARFKAMDVVKFNFWVEADNQAALAFYRRLSYEVRDLVTISRTLRR